MKVKLGWAGMPGEKQVRAVVLQEGDYRDGCEHYFTKPGAEWLIRELQRVLVEWDAAEKGGN